MPEHPIRPMPKASLASLAAAKAAKAAAFLAAAGGEEGGASGGAPAAGKGKAAEGKRVKKRVQGTGAGTATGAGMLNAEEIGSMLKSRISELEMSAALNSAEEQEYRVAVERKDLEEQLRISPSETAERAGELHLKYMEAWEAWKRSEMDVGRERRATLQAEKEREVARAEAAKASRDVQKVTSLCRELQKENKKLAAQLSELQANEKQKEMAMSIKFEETIAHINEKMRLHDERWKSATAQGRGTLEAELRSLREEKELVAEELFSFKQQYMMREKLYGAQGRSKEVEVSLLEARLDREKERADLHSVTSNMLRSKIVTMQQTETELRGQLTLYVEKFRQVEETLNRSNELFANFRKEMEQMSKKTKKLEKDNQAVKARSDMSNGKILEMIEEVKRKEQMILERDARIGDIEKRSALFERLSRTLQKDRDLGRHEMSLLMEKIGRVENAE